MLPLGMCESRAAPGVLLEAMPGVQTIFFQDFMIWCLDYICLAVEVWGLNNLSKERIAPSPDVCIWSSASTTTLWKSLRKGEVRGHLARDLNCRKEGHKWWQSVGRSGCAPPSPPAEQAACSTGGQWLYGSGGKVPGAMACCQRALCTHTWGESSTRMKSPKALLDISHHAVVCNGHLTSQADILRSRRCWSWNITILVTCSTISRKTFTSKILSLKFQAPEIYFCCSKGASLITQRDSLPKSLQAWTEPHSSAGWWVMVALTLPCSCGTEAGKLVTFPRPKSIAALFPSPGRQWQQTGAGEWKRQAERVCGNPLSGPQLRIKWQGSNPRTPPDIPLCVPGPFIPDQSTFLTYPTPNSSSSFPPPQITIFPLSLPSTGPSASPWHFPSCPAPPSPSHVHQPLACTDILRLPMWQTKSTHVRFRPWGNLDVGCAYQKSSGKEDKY